MGASIRFDAPYRQLTTIFDAKANVKMCIDFAHAIDEQLAITSIPLGRLGGQYPEIAHPGVNSR